MMRRLLLALPFLFLALPAHAAACFWITTAGGTWTTTDSADWASTTGGASGSCAATGNVPKNTGDVANFDANSGTNQVTVNTNLTIGEINLTNFGGTLDFATNNNNPTLSAAEPIIDTAGTHTLNMGTGTWTVTSTASSATGFTLQNTSLTLNASTSTLNLKVASCSAINTVTVNWGAHTYATVSLTGAKGCVMLFSGTTTFGNLTLTGPLSIDFVGGATTTISNAYTWTGTSGSEIYVTSSTTSAATISTPSGSTGAWIALHGITFTSNSPTFSNCFDLGFNTTLTCSAPSGGGGTSGNGIIGG